MVAGEDIQLHKTGNAKAAFLFWRPDHDDRKLQSLHDWYGAGVLVGMSNVPLPDDKGFNWFCGKQTATASYYQGLRDGRAIKQDKSLPGARWNGTVEDDDE